MAAATPSEGLPSGGPVASGRQKKPTVVRTKALDKDRFPDLQSIGSVVLKDGPRVRKEAHFAVIRDRHTGQPHHNQLTIRTTNKRKAGETEDEKHSVGLSDEGEDEIKKLRDFLNAIESRSIPGNKSSEVLVVPAGGIDGRALQQLLEEASATGKVQALTGVLRRATQDSQVFALLMNRAASAPHLFAEAAATLNLAAYKAAVDELETLVAWEEEVPEGRFQKILTHNPWMFGSEYSELLDRRRWTRDEQQDFVVRRTTDGYIELIEIKTPLGGMGLFNNDRSHNCLYPGAELSKVVGQVQKYLERLDADRNAILANDGEDTCKIRAKVIIGRDGDPEQRRALRRYNGHLHRIEVLTFDQLLRIARGVLRYLENAIGRESVG